MANAKVTQDVLEQERDQKAETIRDLEVNTKCMHAKRMSGVNVASIGYMHAVHLWYRVNMRGKPTAFRNLKVH